MTAPDERSRDEVDREFEAIVAGWEPEPPSGPAPEDALGDATPPNAQPSTWVVVPQEVWRGPTGDPGQSALDDPPAIDSEDEHFEPPPVTLPPTEDLSYWGSLAGIVLGPLAVIYAALAEPFKKSLIVSLGLAAFLGGFALLLWRQPAHRDHQDPDDGSRV